VEQEGKVHGIRGAGVDELELPVEEIRRWVFFDEKAEDIVLCGGSFLGGWLTWLGSVEVDEGLVTRVVSVSTELYELRVCIESRFKSWTFPMSFWRRMKAAAVDATESVRGG
jgi:hypothetical protein